MDLLELLFSGCIEAVWGVGYRFRPELIDR